MREKNSWLDRAINREKIQEFLILFFLLTPISLFLFRCLCYALMPGFDADIHNYFLSYVSGRREPSFSGIYILQASLFKLIPFLEAYFIPLARLLSSTFVLLGVFFLSLGRKDQILFKFSAICTLLLFAKEKPLWYIAMTHGIWYYALNFLFLSYFIYFIGKGEVREKWKKILFVTILFLATLNKISIVIPFFIFLFFNYKNNKKENLIYGLFLFLFFSLVCFLISDKAQSAMSRPVLDFFIYPRSSVYEKFGYSFSGVLDFFLSRTKFLLDQANLSLYLVLFFLATPFFFKGTSSWRKKSLACILLFFSLFSLSLLGKFIFGSARYNLDFLILFYSTVASGLGFYLKSSEKRYRFLIAFSIFFLCIKNMSIYPQKLARNVIKKKIKYDAYLSLMKEHKAIPSLADYNFYHFLWKYNLERDPIYLSNFPKDEIEVRASIDKKLKFFKHKKFAFYTKGCSWGKFWKKNKLLKRCNNNKYSTARYIRKKYSLVSERCFHHYCLAVFHRKDQK